MSYIQAVLSPVSVSLNTYRYFMPQFFTPQQVTEYRGGGVAKRPSGYYSDKVAQI